jgi:8-oxo-dGTP pyrophosphatase MutT (NUDIX family)
MTEGMRTTREISAGGVAVRRMRGRWWLAAIRPRGRPPGTWALPKGQLDPGEPAAAAALREVREETGLEARLDRKLGDVRYVYARDGRRIFKVVSFFLVRPVRGRLGDLPAGMELEVAEARWLPLDEAARVLAYPSEREMAAEAAAALAAAAPREMGQSPGGAVSRDRGARLPGSVGGP